MTLKDIRDYAKSLVDSTFDDPIWTSWVNTGLATMIEAVPEGITVSEMVPIVMNGGAIPDTIAKVTNVEYSADGGSFAGLPTSYVVTDATVKLADITLEGMLKIYGEPAYVPMVADIDVPANVRLAYQDVPAVYAAWMSQIQDDEQVKATQLQTLYNTRMTAYVNTLRKGKRGLGASFVVAPYWRRG